MPLQGLKPTAQTKVVTILLTIFEVESCYRPQLQFLRGLIDAEGLYSL